ncbi:MAG: cysteinyl-tRNA synthetase [Microgenomates group bacterium LiPW_16]|nr:MAG: cysteinyl-tRNA synthetase [Microgenomates group bacterium LiPW_16]
MKIYNTLTRKIEEFKPIKPGFVGMYTCGPTVYGPSHLGHARSYVNFDLLKRVFLYQGFQVKHILNITDIHDDMIKRASELKITIQELADSYIPLFKKDLEDLNVLPADAYPRVTEHIGKIIEMVKVLLKKGFAYVEKDGSVYFDVSKFAGYGRLSGIKLNKAKTGTRVETDKYEREEATDFALWKAGKEDEPAWSSPWGNGRPGWHIECSVMAGKYLSGERSRTIDLHAGAMDLKFPHHENEIAQSEAANGVKFVNFWFHAGLLEVEGKKMSKSLGNIYTLEDVKKKGFTPLALRYLFLTCHYRDKMNFTWEALEAAKIALENLRSVVANLRQVGESESMVSPEKLKKVLAIPQALATIWEVVKSNIPAPDKLDLLLDFDQVLGLNLAKVPPAEVGRIPEEVEKLVKEREELRKQGKWQEADNLRKKIEEAGFILEDTPEGPRVRPK